MKNYIKKIVESKSTNGLALIRIMTGLIFIAHGSQKLFGIFGGYGLEGTGQFMDSIGLSPGYYMALLAGLGEFVGGLLLLIGLFSRLAGLMTLVVSLVALFSVHINNGFFMATNGIEYIALLAVVSLGLLISGGGKFAIDNIINKKI